MAEIARDVYFPKETLILLQKNMLQVVIAVNDHIRSHYIRLAILMFAMLLSDYQSTMLFLFYNICL